MKKIIRLTENDLARIVRRVISEQDTQVNIPLVWDLSKKLGLKYSKPMGPDQIFFHYGDKASMSKQQIWMDITNGKPTMITVQDERGVKEFPASTPIDKVAIYAKGSANYKKLSSSEPRDVNEEQVTTPSTDNWPIIFSGLKTFADVTGNSPKIIPFTYEGQKITSLNWGNHSDAGRKKPWGISISSEDPDLKFGTQDENVANIYKKLTNKSPRFDGKYFTDDLTLDYSNPQSTISTVKKIIKGLN